MKGYISRLPKPLTLTDISFIIVHRDEENRIVNPNFIFPTFKTVLYAYATLLVRMEFSKDALTVLP